MVRGVIYMYTSPIDKSYIGQTTNEGHRRKLWRSSSYHYAGTKIDRAREKYGPDTFNYKILFEKEFSTKEIATIWLNIIEQYYIKKYNTVEKGYNCEYGGGGHPSHTGAINHHHGGYKLSEETKKRIGEASSKWQNSPEGRAKMHAIRKGREKAKGYRVEKKFKPVVQLSLDGEFIQEFASIRDAGEFINPRNPICKVNIGNTCRGRRDTASGYRWLYKEDYYTYFLNPDKKDMPERVIRQINGISLRKNKNIIRPMFCKRIAQFDLLGNKMREFDSVKEAADFLSKSHSAISQCLSGKRKTAYSYKWMYA